MSSGFLSVSEIHGPKKSRLARRAERRRLNSRHAIEVLTDAMVQRGIPEHIRSNNGPEFVAEDLPKRQSRWDKSSGSPGDSR